MMRLSLIASLLAVEPCFVFYVELKELCDMMKQVPLRGQSI